MSVSATSAGQIGGRGSAGAGRRAQFERTASLRDHAASPGFRIYSLDLTRWEPLDGRPADHPPRDQPINPGVLDRCALDLAQTDHRLAAICLLHDLFVVRLGLVVVGVELHHDAGEGGGVLLRSSLHRDRRYIRTMFMHSASQGAVVLSVLITMVE